MTTDYHLNQLDLVLAQCLATLDRNTAQLKQHLVVLKAIDGTVDKHSDQIALLLKQTAEMEAIVTAMQGEIAELKVGQATTNTKLDLILDLLGNRPR